MNFLLGVLGLGLVAALVALVMPRDAPREVVPATRNAALLPASQSPVGKSSAPGAMTVDGDRFVLAVDAPEGTRFVTTGDGSDVAVNIDGRSIRFDRVVFDSTLGVSVLRTDATTNFAASPTRAPGGTPPVGTSVVVRGSIDVPATIGISITTDTSSFVPLAGEVFAVDVAESSPVEDSSGRLLGLYTERGSARGYIPIGAIDVLLSRSR